VATSTRTPPTGFAGDPGELTLASGGARTDDPPHRRSVDKRHRLSWLKSYNPCSTASRSAASCSTPSGTFDLPPPGHQPRSRLPGVFSALAATVVKLEDLNGGG
jgi:hypothetical protein